MPELSGLGDVGNAILAQPGVIAVPLAVKRSGQRGSRPYRPFEHGGRGLEENGMDDWHIELRPDYGCHSVWTDTGHGSRVNTDPADLPVEPALARDLHAWAAEFDATLDQEYPPDSGFADPQTEDAFWARGMLLACRLAIGLAGWHAVSYWDGRLCCLVPLLSADGGVQVDQARLVLPDHWLDLDREPTTTQSDQSESDSMGGRV